LARRHWAVVFVSDETTGVKQFRFSRERSRLAIALVLIVIALGGSLLVGAIGNPAGTPDARLLRTNALLRGELDELSLRMDSLRAALDGLAAKDEHYRLLAGLEPFDAGMRLVGVGAPGFERAEDNALHGTNRVLARRTYNANSQLGALLRRARLLAFSWREAEDSLSEKRRRLESLPSITPANGYISSSFSPRRWHPILDRPRPHTGIDIVAPAGSPVVATARGEIAFVGEQGEYGLMIDIDHGYGHVTRYAHLSRARVRIGQAVMRGDTIGAVGRSGLAVGPHLHYEVLIDGRPANPRRYLMDFRVVPE
jgi:murein DD-endopeptidase MepM/ murein hydrolase activator NlpD